MARTFTTAFNNILISDSIRYFFLMKLELNSTYYFTSFNRDISWDNQTWVADGGVFEVDTPRNSSIIDREAYKLVVTDLSNEFSNEFEAGVIGAPLNVWVGLVDSNGNPLTSSGNILSVYSGFVDSPSISIDWETKYATLEGTSPMADLDQVNLFMVSRDGMEGKNSSDTSFADIFEDSEARIGWGKI